MPDGLLSDADVGLGGTPAAAPASASTPLLSDSDVGLGPTTSGSPNQSPRQAAYVDEARQNRSGAAGYVDTAVRGLARAMPFMDDVAAAGDTAASYLGLNTAPVGKADQAGMSLGDRYNDNLERERAVNQADDTDRPVTSIGTQIAGGLALPIGPAAKAVGFVPKVATGALVGAGYGALYGAGQGDGLADRLSKAETGAGLGAAGGAIAPVLMGGIGAGIDAAKGVRSTVQRVLNPNAAAENKVVSTLARDMQQGGTGLTADQWGDAAQSGAPVVVGDAGGEATRSLARSAANTSPEARQALQQATQERYGDQSSRLSDALNGMFPGGLDNTATRETLQGQAAFVNRNAYSKAYNDPNAQSMWGDDFQRLAQAPAVQSAIRDAQTMAGNRSVMAGEQSITNPFMKDADGNLVPRTNPDGSTVTPTLRFWDQVQRSLRDSQQSAARSGANEQASVAGQLRSQLLAAMEHPETGVPSFGEARTGAFKAFAAEDALTAGQSFAGATKAEAITDQMAAIKKMSPPEKELFARGFASQISQKASNAGDSRNVAGMFDSQAFRDKAQAALGSQRANQLEAQLRVESTMNFLKNAVGGNSTTARQMLEMGLASGASGALEAWHEGHIGLGTVAMGVAGGLLHHGYGRINEAMARHVGELLASDNPDLVTRATQQISTRPRFMGALRDLDQKLPAVFAQRLAPGAS